MSGRNLSNLAGFQNRTLTGLSNIVTAESDIQDIKSKYDFTTESQLGSLLIGNSEGNYTSNTLTAGTNINIVNSNGGINISSTDTNFFEKTNNDIRAENTSDNLLLGTTTNTNSRKLVVDGTTHITGTLFLGDKINNLTIPAFVTDTFCLIDATQTLTNKSISYDQLTSTPTIPSNNNQLTNGAGYITASSTETLTNKSISYSQLTGTPTIPANLWTTTNNTELHAILDYNLTVGTSGNTNNRKFLVLGTADISGQLFLGDKINNLSLPQNVTDIFCVLATSQALTNKDLTSATNTFPTFNQDTTGNAASATKIATITNSNIVQLTGSQTLEDKTLTSPAINTAVSGTAILDEDDLVSNSATKLATQQSIKSYVDTLKTKYDFTTTVSNGKLLIGNSAGNYTVNNLTAGSNITITNTNGNISIASTASDNYFSKVSSNIYPINTSDNLLVGTSSNTAPYKLSVVGTTNISGKLTLESTINDLTLPSGIDTFCVLNANQTLDSKTFTNANLSNANNTFPTFNQDTTGNAATATKITTITNSNIVQLTGSQELTDKTINNPLLTGAINSTIFRLHDKSLNNTYSIKTKELLSNHILTIPAIYNDTGEFLITDSTQTLTNKTLTSPIIDTPNIRTSSQFNIVNIFSSIITFGNSTDKSNLLNINVITNGLARNVIDCTNNGIIRLGNTNENTEITRGLLVENTLTGTTGVAGIRLYIEDQSINHFYNLKVSELTGNRDIRLPVLLNNDGHFVVNNVAQTLTNKSIPSITNNTFGIDVSSPRTTLDLARNYPTDTTSNSGEATNIFLNTKNSIGDSSGVVWKPNFSGYSKTSAYINFMPTGNFFRGELHFGANFTSDQTSAARKVMKISHYGQYLYANGIVWSPVSTSNNWYPLCYWEGNVISSVGGGALNNGGATRKFVWAVESTSGSFRALGLFANNSDANTTTSDVTASGFTFMGFFQPFAKTTTYSFTASHRCFSNNNELYNEDMIGLIVESTGEYDSLYKNPIIDEIENNENDNIEEIILDDGAGIDPIEIEEIEEIEENKPIIDNPIIDNSENYNIDIDNAVPIVDLCKSRKSKKVLGVIAKFEIDGDKRHGMDFGYIQVCDKDKNRLYINSIGEGGVWVCNSNGNFENGDYIQSSNVNGYGEVQDDDILHNYTLGKITMDIDFNNLPTGFKTRNLDNNIICILAGCIYVAG